MAESDFFSWWLVLQMLRKCAVKCYRYGDDVTEIVALPALVFLVGARATPPSHCGTKLVAGRLPGIVRLCTLIGDDVDLSWCDDRDSIVSYCRFLIVRGTRGKETQERCTL